MPNHPVTVLIADDDPLFQSALEAILGTEESIDVIGSALDGAEATRLALELEPAVVLMDLSMPVMDGFEATRLISRELRGTTVVVLTGSADETDVAKARAAGAVGYVTKDRIGNDLVRVVAAAVGQVS